MTGTKKDKKKRPVDRSTPNPTNRTVDALVASYPNIPPNVLHRLNALLGMDSPRQVGRQLRELFHYMLFPNENGFQKEQLDELWSIWELMEALCDAPAMRQDLLESVN